MPVNAQDLVKGNLCCKQLESQLEVTTWLNASILMFNFTDCINENRLRQIVQQYTNQTFLFPTSTVIILVIAYCVVVVLGLLGNLLVILVIFRKKELRTSKNIYILNLSVCDVIMSAICMPFSLVKLTLKKWTLGPVMCRIVPALATIDVFVSTFTIVVIALDRYKAIVQASQMNRRKVLVMLGIIWAGSTLLSTPLFCFHKIETQELYDHTLVQQCIDDWPDDRFREVYTTVVMLVQYLTPASVISCLHARICNFLRYRHDERPGTDTQIAAMAKTAMRRHRRNMMLLTAMALVFSITWLPLTVLNVVADLDHKLFREKQYNLLHAISLLIAMSSSVANPIMYGFFNSNFRRAFCDLVRVSYESKVSFDINGREKKTTRKNVADFKSSGKESTAHHSVGRRRPESSSGIGFPKAASLANVHISRSQCAPVKDVKSRFVEAIIEASSCPELLPGPREAMPFKETDKLKCEIHKRALNASYDSFSSD